MSKIAIGEFELSTEYVDRLLAKLNVEGVRNEADLRQFLKGYTYMNDASRKCHLLISPNAKKESFALPYE